LLNAPEISEPAAAKLKACDEFQSCGLTMLVIVPFATGLENT
jgi:hypothetical protein